MVRALRGKQVGNNEANSGLKVSIIANQLNARGILTPRGGAWHPTSVSRLIERLSA
jgi:hypothetical protein